MDINKVKNIAKQGNFEEALSQCDQLFHDYPQKKTELLRLRAYIFSLSGDYSSALRDRKAIIDKGEGKLRDYYLAGDNALTLGKFGEASKWFQAVLQKSQEQKENWFDSAALFLLSYAEMEMGNLDSAIDHLNRAKEIEPECSMPLPQIGIWSIARLKTEITNRQK